METHEYLLDEARGELAHPVDMLPRAPEESTQVVVSLHNTSLPVSLLHSSFFLLSVTMDFLLRNRALKSFGESIHGGEVERNETITRKEN